MTSTATPAPSSDPLYRYNTRANSHGTGVSLAHTDHEGKYRPGPHPDTPTPDQLLNTNSEHEAGTGATDHDDGTGAGTGATGHEGGTGATGQTPAGDEAS